MTATLLRPLTQDVADTIAVVLHAVEHVNVGVHVANDASGPCVHIWPVGRAATTAEEVTALRAFCGATDTPVRWHPAVA